jgi:Leucine-rich repeat (LRR) protein
MKLLFILLAFPIIGFGQNVNIPDANFKAYLVGNTAINTNGDNQIQVSEASVYNGAIYCSFMNISNLTGIEAFVSLTSLDCNNNLTSLNVSTCTALTDLNCSGNQLTSLNVSSFTALTNLNCSGNQLTSLDVTSCTALWHLDCYNNQLTSLDVSSCTALTYLDCDGNQLNSLDVSGCTALTGLHCEGNQLTSLDVSSCTAIGALYCYDNQLTSLDVSSCTALGLLYCHNNQLTSLDVKNGYNINMPSVFDPPFGYNHAFLAYNNPNLSCIEVDNVAWSQGNWANNIDSTAYFSLNCSGAGISDINESNTLMIYPNPTNGDFTITGLELVGTVSSLSLTDMNGKVVKVLDPKATKFSMASIKPGVYFLNIISGNKQEVIKIVKE